jgi:hypothetical protein
MADLTDHVIQYLASIRLYDPGQGDPVVTDHGMDWYDILAQSFALGVPSYAASGQAHLEYLPDVGLVCRPFLTLQDTRLAHYTFHNAADWDEVRPAAGTPRHYRLFQQNTTANLFWYATSVFSLPTNPSVAFSFIFSETPSDQDNSLAPPFVRIELGGTTPTWGIEFNKTEGCRLMAYRGGQWVDALQLQEPTGLGFGDNEEKVVVIRVQRGKLCISTDWGKTYTQFGFPDGTPVTVPAGKWTLRGTGGMIAFGLQQIVYNTGTWTSSTRNTFTSRLLPVIPTFTPRKAEAGGSSVGLADLSNYPGGVAQYRATLTPGKQSGFPWDFYTSPELYSVLMSYPVVRSTPTLTWTTPWDGELRDVHISKPAELDQGQMTWSVRAVPANPFTYGGRWRKVACTLTELHDDGTTTAYAAFVGYVKLPSAEQAEYGEMPLSFTAENASIRARRTEWNELVGTPPLGGLTVNQALDKCLDRIGLTAAYRTWHVLGNAVLLPPGLAEDPFLWPKSGESVWQTMTDIASFAGLELFVDDFGVYTTLPKNFVQPLVSKVWDLAPATDLKQLALSVKFSWDAGENTSSVLVKGQDPWGHAVYGYAIDAAAEQDPTNVRFTPWRETFREEIPFPITPAMAVGRAQFLYQDQCVPKFYAEVEGLCDLSLSRRDRVQVLNSAVGISNANVFGILTLDHTWTGIDRVGEIRTKAGLRRLGG